MKVIEAWRPVNGFPGYEISNFGSVKSYKHKKAKLLKMHPFDGYFKVKLCNNPKETTVSVHLLVARNWIPNPYNLPEVDHVDCNKKNNYFKNLEWVTKQENLRRCRANGLNTIVRGQYNGASKLKDIDIAIVREACSMFGKGSQTKVAKYYGVTVSAISLIMRGKNWRHL